MTYAQKVATGLLASMPALQLNQTDKQGKKHKYTIQSVFDLNKCYADLSVRNELTTGLLLSYLPAIRRDDDQLETKHQQIILFIQPTLLTPRL